MATDFTTGNALTYGWAKMKEHFTLFLMIFGVIIAVQLVQVLFQNHDASFIIGIVAFVIALIFQLGLYRIVLDIMDERRPKFKDLITQTNLLPEYIIGSVLYILIVVGGLILLIIPGIIWAIKYQYYGYLIVDKKLSPMDAIRKSGQITKGYKWQLLGFWFAMLGVNILGLLALGIGLLVTIPATIVAQGYVYRTLVGKQPSLPRPAGTAKKAVAKKKKR